ncbi:Esterase LovG [Cytospora mali]|uniref:Esterase LovG n=1 Tax=Cytospora mali TaxID=578113 RepID=A0A194V5F2_CYTMA|nr:Esterase LovG [Valsa mali var. pyri (nom. inval.)]
MNLVSLPPPTQATLGHPRILMLHGGGTNSRIFHMQCRGLEYRLNKHFRLVFAEAPYHSTAGPDVLSVYAECGPFKRWVLTTSPNTVEEQPKETWEGVERAIADAMDADDKLGATGEWVAVLGFSQGAKMAASILLRQQEIPETLGRLRRPGSSFRFGVLMAGRGPLLQVDPDEADWLGADEKFDYKSNVAANRVLRLPTVHVHGLLDPGLDFHRILLNQWCDPSSTTLVQWDGNHRLPIKTVDVEKVVNAILDVAREEGISLKE